MPEVGPFSEAPGVTQDTSHWHSLTGLLQSSAPFPKQVLQLEQVGEAELRNEKEAAA